MAGANRQKKGGGELWKISQSDRLQVWPKNSGQIYLFKATRFMQKRFVDNKNICEPPKLPFDLPDTEGIESAGIALHKKNFYISRCDKNIIGVIYVLAGAYRVRAENRVFTLKRGMFFAAPAGTLLADSAPFGDVKALWFRLKNTPFWRRAAGAKIHAKKSPNFAKIAFLASLYAEEAYAERRSVLYLQSVLKTLAAAIGRDLQSDGEPLSEPSLESIASRAAKDFKRKISAPQAAKMAGMPLKKFNAAFEKQFGRTFAKFVLQAKMRAALEMLQKGATLRKIAGALAFADAYALSNSFKKFYGKSPRNFLREA